MSSRNLHRLRAIFPAAIFILAAGCANEFAAHYQPNRDASGALSANPSAPRVVQTASIRSELPKYVGQGYVIVGHSSFDSDEWRPNRLPDAVTEGKAVGADLVLYKTRDLGRKTETYTATFYDGDPKHSTADSTEETIEKENFRYIAVYLKKPGGA